MVAPQGARSIRTQPPTPPHTPVLPNCAAPAPAPLRWAGRPAPTPPTPVASTGLIETPMTQTVRQHLKLTIYAIHILFPSSTRFESARSLYFWEHFLCDERTSIIQGHNRYIFSTVPFILSKQMLYYREAIERHAPCQTLPSSPDSRVHYTDQRHPPLARLLALPHTIAAHTHTYSLILYT